MVVQPLFLPTSFMSLLLCVTEKWCRYLAHHYFHWELFWTQRSYSAELMTYKLHGNWPIVWLISITRPLDQTITDKYNYISLRGGQDHDLTSMFWSLPHLLHLVTPLPQPLLRHTNNFSFAWLNLQETNIRLYPLIVPAEIHQYVSFIFRLRHINFKSTTCLWRSCSVCVSTKGALDHSSALLLIHL